MIWATLRSWKRINLLNKQKEEINMRAEMNDQKAEIQQGGTTILKFIFKKLIIWKASHRIDKTKIILKINIKNK